MVFPFAPGAAAISLETGAAYVGGQFGFSTSATLSSLGAQVGDLLITMSPQLTGTAVLSSGNPLTDLGGQFFSRVLNSGDIAGTVNWGGRSVALVIYRGAASAAPVVNGGFAPSGSGQTTSGYTKNAAHAGQFGVLFSDAIDATLSIDDPPAWAARGTYDAGYLANRRTIVADRLQPVNPFYVSGTSFTWSSTGTNNGLRILELRK